MERVPRIKSVLPVGDDRLRVRFDNDVEKIYDCAPLLSQPQFALLKNPALFRGVKVDSGGYGISWNDDMDLSEYELWTNGRTIADPSLQPLR